MRFIHRYHYCSPPSCNEKEQPGGSQSAICNIVVITIIIIIIMNQNTKSGQVWPKLGNIRIWIHRTERPEHPTCIKQAGIQSHYESSVSKFK